ncbi:MAG: hypothetical protein PHR94_05805 [Methylomonas lenta]|nr:hypothetical protein [Methylomonas lenta]
MSTQFNEDEKFESSKWKMQMFANGAVFKNQKVRQVLLVHGTFVGDNALGIYDFLEPIERSLTGYKTITNQLESFGKDVINHLVKDVGNYTPEYTEALSQGLNNDIACDLFVWGSGDFHLARLKGAVGLAKQLSEKISDRHIREGEHILLIGHSHAGQLFALLTTLLEGGEKAEQLYKVIDQSSQLGKKADLLSYLKTIKPIYLDIVTFGTPVRYAWGHYDNYRLLAIVNHRSPVDIKGLLTTRDGDYVQQWGAEGTDVFPTFERALNDSLDVVLDKGKDPSLLIASLAHKNRNHPHYVDGSIVSETLLIDYKDNADSILKYLDVTHCVKTLFGHGVYTEYRAMLFNLNTIVEKLYR